MIASKSALTVFLTGGFIVPSVIGGGGGGPSRFRGAWPGVDSSPKAGPGASAGGEGGRNGAAPPDNGAEGGGVVDWGEPFSFGNGEMRVFFDYSPGNGKPKELGVKFPASTLVNTPTEESDGLYDVRTKPGANSDVVWYCCGHEIIPKFPQSVLDNTAFEHGVFNFNPMGHVPTGIYDLPHIDFHFYTQSNEDRLAIPGVEFASQMCSPQIPMTCAEAAALAAPVPADEQPPRHTNVDAVEPAMCNHLINLNSKEFQEGQTFDHTFIFPTCYGHLCGAEPMITIDFIKSLKTSGTLKVCECIPNPQAFPEAGYYPTEYCMEYLPDEDAYTVSLTQWRHFDASDGIVEDHWQWVQNHECLYP